MFFWSRNPFVRLAVCLSLGILGSIYFPVRLWITAMTLLSILLFLFWLYFNNRKLLFSQNWIFGLLIMLLCFFLGYSRPWLFDNKRQDIASFSQNKQYFTGVVVSSPTVSNSFQRVKFQLLSIKTDSIHTSDATILLYIRDTLINYRYGDVFLIDSKLQLVESPKNPFEFNYQQYLFFQGIRYQAFTNSDRMVKMGNHPPNFLIKQSLDARHYFEQVLERSVTGKEEVALLKALLLGNKSELDSEVKERFAATGAMHVLAVSGLHVGIIYLLLLWLLRQNPDKITKPVLVAGVVIPVLWAYAFITGLSPSVLRAVTLFSLLALGMALTRKASTINSLAVSAFILLLIDPFLIMSVGFQMSYIAVLGILMIYPVIRRQWIPEGKILIFIWQLIAVSIAAQLAIFPLSIFYFHRFPTYFLFSNLLVIPAAIAIIWGGVALLILGSVWPTAGVLLGKILGLILVMLKWGLSIFQRLPGSNVGSLTLSVSETWLVYLFLTGIVLLIYTHRKSFLFINMVLILLFFGNRIYHISNEYAFTGFTIYRIPNHWAIDFIQSGHSLLLSDLVLPEDAGKINFNIQPNQIARYLRTIDDKESIAHQKTEHGELISWHGKLILIANGCSRTRFWSNMDYVVVPSCYQYGRRTTAGVWHFDSSRNENFYNLESEGALTIALYF